MVKKENRAGTKRITKFFLRITELCLVILLMSSYPFQSSKAYFPKGNMCPKSQDSVVNCEKIILAYFNSARTVKFFNASTKLYNVKHGLFSSLVNLR